MDFKWKVTRPALTHSDGEGVMSVTSPGVTLVIETGSVKEVLGIFEEEDTSLAVIFGKIVVANGKEDLTRLVSEEAAATSAVETKPRTRGPAKPKQEAVAPPPLPVPAAPVATATLPPNPLGTADDGGIPPGLKRDPVTNEAPALLAAPPPLLPAPPLAPLPPTAPPVGVLGPKVVAALELHKEGKQDGGQALADWLASAGLTQKGATYDEACRVVLMTSDSKLTELGIARAFKVAA